MKVDFKILIFAILIPLAVGAVGSAFTFPEIATWYQTLNKPDFNPPNWIFAPVWTTLYILMGISFYLVLISKAKDKIIPVKLFMAQLVLNILWSVIFFGLHNPLLAFFEILVLWGTILFMILTFYKISKPAAYLMIPYILWVSFASILNLSIVIIN